MPADDAAPDVLDRCDTDTIRLDCPIDCLQAVTSAAAFNLLARAYHAPFAPPATVGDVVELIQRHQLGKIWGLGPRRIAEIEVSLVLAGIVTAHGHPASAPPTAREP
jgi:hypothetical protein